MTDRLTPAMLRDLADVLWPVDVHKAIGSDVPLYHAASNLRREAARREAEHKPAPAADDLVRRLRGRACDSWEICEQAADRIEQADRAIAGFMRSTSGLAAENAQLRDALKCAAKRFRWYEEIHASKTPPDDDKAKRNREFAEDCEAALARGGER